MTDLTTLTIAEAGRLLRARSIRSRDLTAAYLNRIDGHGVYNAYITVTHERAIEDAARADREIAAGLYRGPLHGIPIALKDIIATAGIRTTCGSQILRDWVPDEDAAVAQRLRAAGSVLLGKLNTHEFAMGPTNVNPHFGAARNPWDLTKVSGGSSGGAGVAVVARLAMAAIGTDTGGSVRIPAALCGCVGFKPTYGRVSKTGVFPLSSMRDHVGPLARTVRDAAIVLEVIEGYDPEDPNSANLPRGDYLSGLDDRVDGIVVGVPGGRFEELATREVAAAVRRAVRVLRAAGARIVEVDLALPGPDADAAISFASLAIEARHYHADHLPVRMAEYGDDLQRRFGAADVSIADIGTAMARAETVRRAFQRALSTVDVLVTPTTPFVAPPIGAARVTVDGRSYTDLDLSLFTAPMNVARLPALSVPCGRSTAGLPIGFTITGNAFAEGVVLRVGRAYERNSGGSQEFAPEPAG